MLHRRVLLGRRHTALGKPAAEAVASQQPAAPSRGVLGQFRRARGVELGTNRAPYSAGRSPGDSTREMPKSGRGQAGQDGHAEPKLPLSYPFSLVTIWLFVEGTFHINIRVS